MTLFHFLWAHATSEGGLGMVVIIWLHTMFPGLTVLLQPGSDPPCCSTMIDHNSSWENALLKSSTSCNLSSKWNFEVTLRGGLKQGSLCHRMPTAGTLFLLFLLVGPEPVCSFAIHGILLAITACLGGQAWFACPWLIWKKCKYWCDADFGSFSDQAVCCCASSWMKLVNGQQERWSDSGPSAEPTAVPNICSG